MTRLARHIALALLAVAAFAAAAQDTTATRRVTPVRPSTNVTLQPGRDVSAEVVERYITGDSASMLAEQRRDSLRRNYTRYPRLTDIAVGVNFVEPLLMAFGQDYASFDFNATLNMWNRLQPTVEIGIGWGRNKPEDLNYTYRAKLSPYVKIGANYNFLFKSDPKYQVTAGVRLAYSNFGFDITDINYANSYWQEQITLDITHQRAHAFWAELTAGIKVHLIGRWALGWNIRWHRMLSAHDTPSAHPWFVPGFGPRNSSIAFAMTAYYQFQL